MTAERNIKFILASASPRRKELLQKAGYNFDVICSAVDEAAFPTRNIAPAYYAAAMAVAKAQDVAEKFPHTLVMGADTIADFDGEIIGKADDPEHAQKIVRKLFSRPHKIITAVALIKIDTGLKVVSTDTTVVYPRPMSEQQINSHIKNGSWQGKAGAYAIQETGDEFVEKIDGSITNVMGLPMELVERMLKQLP